MSNPQKRTELIDSDRYGRSDYCYPLNDLNFSSVSGQPEWCGKGERIAF